MAGSRPASSQARRARSKQVPNGAGYRSPVAVTGPVRTRSSGVGLREAEASPVDYVPVETDGARTAARMLAELL